MNYSDYFPITEYYKKVVMPIDRRYFMKGDKMMVCPLHEDVNPSMGIVRTKEGKELYHCFGCNSWGDVVDLHQKVTKRLKKRYISKEAALKELCQLFNVDYDEVSTAEEENKADTEIRVTEEIQKRIDAFDFADFRNMITDGKLKGKGVAYFNTLMLMMIDTLKEGGDT